MANVIFEIERRGILFKPETTLPNGTLGYDDDPNLITSPITEGEYLLYYSPKGTRYLQYDSSGNAIEWFKKAMPNGWVTSIPGDSQGTNYPSWAINMSDPSNYVVLDTSMGDLLVKTYDGSLGVIVIGGLRLGNETGYLRAIDGSVFSDKIGYSVDVNPSTYLDPINENWVPSNNGRYMFQIDHNLGTVNHHVSVYEIISIATNKRRKVHPEIVIDENSDLISFTDTPGGIFRVVITSFKDPGASVNFPDVSTN